MKKVNAAEFREIVQNHPYVVVKFATDWCTHCKPMSQHIKLAEPDFPQIQFLEIDADHELDLAFEFGIKAAPTIVFVSHGAIEKESNGEIKRLVGKRSPDELKEAFEWLIR